MTETDWAQPHLRPPAWVREMLADETIEQAVYRLLGPAHPGKKIKSITVVDGGEGIAVEWE